MPCRTAGLTSFPDYLVLHMRKFVMEVGWVPKKLDISHMRSKGCQPGEELLPEGGKCFVRAVSILGLVGFVVRINRYSFISFSYNR